MCAQDSVPVHFIEGGRPRHQSASENWLDSGPDAETRDTPTVQNSTSVELEEPTVEIVGQPHLIASGCSSQLHKVVRDKNRLRKKLNHLQQRCINQSLMLRTQRKEVAKLKVPLHKKLLKDDDSCVFYTGIPGYRAFSAICTYAKSHKEECNKAKGKRTAKVQLKYYKRWNSAVVNKRLCLEDCVLLALMKLRLGLLRKDLADRLV